MKYLGYHHSEQKKNDNHKSTEVNSKATRLTFKLNTKGALCEGLFRSRLNLVQTVNDQFSCNASFCIEQD
jgi:hypothetical protein